MILASNKTAMITQDPPEDYDELEGSSPLSSINHLENRLAVIESDRNKSATILSSLSDSDKKHPPKYHVCFNILMTRKKVVQNQKYRIKLIHDILSVKPQYYLNVSLAEDNIVKDWYKLYINHSSSWNNTNVAHGLCDFELILDKDRKMVAKVGKYPPQIEQFRDYMNKVKEAAEMDRFTSSKVSNKKIGAKKTEFGFKVRST